MKLKIDENLPQEAADLLNEAGFDAHTVDGENLSGSGDGTIASVTREEHRILVTLDMDFANIRAYPPGEYSGIIVMRPGVQINGRSAG